jgi:cell division septal protein FtsQ
VLGLVGVVWLAVYILTAPEFQVSAVRVSGTQLVPERQVADAAGLTGHSVFLVNSRQAEHDVLAVKPIESASVSFLWPSVVSISAVERRPYATWRTGSAAFLVCESGVVLAPASGQSLPVAITDVDAQPLYVGGQVDKDVLKDAAYLLTALRPTGLNVTAFEYSKAYGLVAPSDRGLKVAFGRGPDLPAKVATLRALLDELSARKISAQFIDMRAKERPFFR